MATGIPKSPESKDGPPIRELNARALNLVHPDDPRINPVLARRGTYQRGGVDPEGRTCSISFKPSSHSVNALRGRYDNPDSESRFFDVETSFVWDSDAPENTDRQRTGKWHGFRAVDMKEIDEIISVIEHS